VLGGIRFFAFWHTRRSVRDSIREMATDIGVPQNGPFKTDHYRY
jgi:hypothetical protein